MICACGGVCEWQGPLDNPTGTRCTRCGATNSQVVQPREGNDEGDPCGVDACTGTLQFELPEDCTCHISPPCSACVDSPLRCTTCERQA